MTEINMTIEEIEEYLNSFPPGYKFDPSDEELIAEYLLRKVNDEKLPVNLMHEVNIYKENPEYLAEKYRPQGSKGWYFFTSRDKKYLNGSRPDRKAGDGFWKATGADKTIKRNNVEVGFRKALVFYKGRPPKGHKTSWIMHEFRLAPHLVKKRRNHSSIHGVANNMRLDDFILSRIYKKNKPIPKDKSPREQKVENKGSESQEDEIVVEGESPKKSPVIEEDINCSGNIYNTSNLPYNNVNVCTMVDNNGIPNIHIYGASSYNDNHNVPISDNNVYTSYSYGDDYPSVQPTNQLMVNASISDMNVINPSTSYVGLHDWDPYDQAYGDDNFLEDLNSDYINNYFDHSILLSLLDPQNPTMIDADLDLNPIEAVNMSNPSEQHSNEEIEVKDDLSLSTLAPQHTPPMEVHGSYPIIM